jgi:hypothetical protein
MSKPSAATATAVDGAGSSRPKVINFAVFDQGSDNEDERDELDSYFDAPWIGLDADPVQWWYARKAEYPRLYQLARDIMSIPGKIALHLRMLLSLTNFQALRSRWNGCFRVGETRSPFDVQV